MASLLLGDRYPSRVFERIPGTSHFSVAALRHWYPISKVLSWLQSESRHFVFLQSACDDPIVDIL